MQDYSIVKGSTLGRSESDRKYIAKDFQAERTLPRIGEIHQLAKRDPRQVVAFANGFFASRRFGLKDRVDVALALIPQLNEGDRVHLWEALATMVRIENAMCDERLFNAAKQVLCVADLDSDEAGAICDFLSDLRVFGMCNATDPTQFGGTVDECDLFVGINTIVRSGDETQICQMIHTLVECVNNHSFLVRESVAEGLGVLCTRSDLADSVLRPYLETIRSLLEQLKQDSHQYVRRAALIVESLIEIE